MSAPYVDPYSAAGVAAAARAAYGTVGLHATQPGELEEHFISINGRQVIPFPDDGQKTATISVHDTSVLRGDGVFEVMKVIFVKERSKVMDFYVTAERPRIRCLERHLERLQTSASAVQCPLPPMDVLKRWIDEAISRNVNFDMYGDDGGAAVRLMFTKGNSTRRIPPSTIISVFRLPKWPDSFTLRPIEAPWHPAGVWEEWSTPIKWTSYGPNVVSTQKAKSRGYTDALLVSPHRVSVKDRSDVDCWKTASVPITQWHVLDGPNFAIGFIEYGQSDTTEQHSGRTKAATAATTTKATARGATLHLPSNEKLGLLPSITQKIVSGLARTKLNMKVVRGIYKLETLLDKADEIFVTSTTRGIKCVTSVGNLGNKTFPTLQETRYTKQLVKLLEDYTGEEEEEDSDDDEDDNGDGGNDGDDGGNSDGKRKDDGTSEGGGGNGGDVEDVGGNDVPPPQPPITPWKALLVRLGINIDTANELALHGFVSMEAFQEYDAEGIDDLVRQLLRYAHPSRPRGAVVYLNVLSVEKLKVLRYWIDISKMVGIALTPNFFTDTVFAATKNRMRELKDFKKAEADQIPKTPDPLKKWTGWKQFWDSWNTFMGSIRGVADIPLTYVYREHKVVTNAIRLKDYTSNDERYHNIVQLEGSHFDADNSRVWSELKSLTQDGPAWDHIKRYEKTRDGRAAILKLTTQTESTCSVNARKTRAYKSLKELSYDGGRRNWSFEQYLNGHLKAHNELLDCKEEPFEAKKIRDFFDNITDPRLDNAKEILMGDPVKYDTFDKCQQYMMLVIANKSVAGRSDNGTRKIAELERQKLGQDDRQSFKGKLEAKSYSRKDWKSMTDAQRTTVNKLRGAEKKKRKAAAAARPEEEQEQETDDAGNQFRRNAYNEDKVTFKKKKTKRIKGENLAVRVDR